ncbi:hypothetical protein [Acidithiobacillus ferrooxidans]|uniref:hypothetical protein n=1 Tax=Acidithiobacillus ferrooxidans TaxID=920 RepID=UPI000A4B153C|nr:hypothetical protein [Acidithiobacillus ferrooxidans]
MRYPTIDRLAARERLARGYSSASAESDGDDPNDPVVVSEQDWLAAIAIAKRIYADYLDHLDRMSGSGPKDAYLYSAAVELFVDSHDYDPANLLRYATSRGINIISVSDVNDLDSAVYALLWAYTEAEVFVETPIST